MYADLTTFAERLASGDATLLDEQESGGETGSAFAGELFRFISPPRCGGGRDRQA